MVLQAEGHGEGEVCAGGETGEDYAGGVEAEVVGVGGQVEEGVYTVVDGGGKGMFWGTTVADGYHNAGSVFEDGAEPIPIIEVAAEDETASVVVDDDGITVGLACCVGVTDPCVIIGWDVKG